MAAARSVEHPTAAQGRGVIHLQPIDQKGIPTMSNNHARTVGLVAKASLLCLVLGLSVSACDQPPTASDELRLTEADATKEKTDDGVDVIARAVSLAGRSGYVVKVHTCDRSGADTDAVISLSPIVRDVNWERWQLRPDWVLDHSNYDDQRRNKTDVYFFPESMKAYHFEELRVMSNGGTSSKGSWCWDRISITRIEAGATEWTWVWERSAEWVNPGDVFDYTAFTSGHNGESIPSDVKIPGGFAPDHGSVFVSYAYQIPSSWSCPTDITLEGTGVGARAPFLNRSVVLPAQLDVCEYSTTFTSVAPGQVAFSATQPSAAGVKLLGRKTINVAAGVQHVVQILPNQFE